MNNVIYKIGFRSHKDFYIGSATIFNRRKLRHMHELRNKKHSNVFMQRLFNKYGEKDLYL